MLKGNLVRERLGTTVLKIKALVTEITLHYLHIMLSTVRSYFL